MSDVRVLTCAEAAEATRYTSKRFRELVATGHMPPPIDPDLSPRRQRWSSLAIDAYVRGEFKPNRNGSAA